MAMIRRDDEAVSSLETSVSFYKTTRRSIPEDSLSSSHQNLILPLCEM
jgi:hypothetical protein